MENKNNRFDLFLKAFLVVGIILLFVGFIYLYLKVENLSSDINSLKTLDLGPKVAQTESATQSLSLDDINNIIAQAIATISAAPTQKVVEKQTVVTEPGGTTYIPMGTTATTTSTDWVDIEVSGVYIDVENDYGKDATVSWETWLKVAHGNGQVFARLYDDTNKIAVDRSEISTTDNVSFEQVSSGNLPFWRGRNLYKVQIKSLNSFEVTYSGGKIKISY